MVCASAGSINSIIPPPPLSFAALPHALPSLHGSPHVCATLPPNIFLRGCFLSPSESPGPLCDTLFLVSPFAGQYVYTVSNSAKLNVDGTEVESCGASLVIAEAFPVASAHVVSRVPLDVNLKVRWHFLRLALFWRAQLSKLDETRCHTWHCQHCARTIQLNSISLALPSIPLLGVRDVLARRCCCTART